MWSRSWAVGLALGVAAAAGGDARADVVRLRDGRVLRGDVAAAGGEVVVRHRWGEVRVRRSDVVELVEVEEPWEELARRRALQGVGSAHERFAFASWCRRHGFEADAEEALRSVLEVDPDHPGARVALGYVLHEGRWMTEGERWLARGFVPFRGGWVTPAERAARLREEREEAERRRREREEARRRAEEARVEALRRERLEAEAALARAQLRAAAAQAEAAQAQAEAAQARAARRAPPAPRGGFSFGIAGRGRVVGSGACRGRDGWTCDVCRRPGCRRRCPRPAVEEPSSAAARVAARPSVPLPGPPRRVLRLDR